MAKYLLIDGNNIAYRSYYGIKDLARSDGFPTNAVHGWVRTLWFLQDTYKPDHILVFFDHGGSTERLSIHEEYKATRKEMPEGLIKQMPYLKAISLSLGFPVIQELGIEADDIIGAIALKLSNDAHHVSIVSSDKDFAQILSENKINQLLPPPTANPKLGWRILTQFGVKEKFGVEQSQIVDFLSLIGDTSDNIPGLQGVGPKTAIDWLSNYKTLEGVIQNANYLMPKRFQVLLPKYQDLLKKNQQLITLNLNIPLPELSIPPQNLQEAAKIFEELEMRKALADLKIRYK